MAREANKEVLDRTIEVNSLNRQKVNLTQELNKLVSDVSSTKEELINVNGKVNEIISQANDEAQRIKDSASEIYDEAKEAQKEIIIATDDLNQKLANAETLNKKAQDLIKSNEGLENNLKAQSAEFKNKIIKLDSLVSFIQNTLDSIK